MELRENYHSDQTVISYEQTGLSTNAHVLAMTGSFFRGDGVPVLRPEDEARFTPVQCCLILKIP